MTTKRVGPCIYISDLPRTTTKVMWKWIYRSMRVTQRECEKVQMDCITYGTGFMAFPYNEDPKHVPIQEVIIKQ